MARDYGKVMNTFWTEWGQKLRRAGLDAIAVALYLKTGPSANWLGLYSLALPLMAHHLGLSIDDAEQALNLVCQTGYARWDEANEWVFVPHMAAEEIAKQVKPSDKRHSRIVADLHALRNCPFVNDFCEIYADDFSLPVELIRAEGSPLEGASEDLASPFGGPPKPQTEQEQEQEQEQQQQQEQEKFAAAECAAPEKEFVAECGTHCEASALPEDPPEREDDRVEILQALTGIGMPEVARPLAMANPALARAVLAHCRSRFAAKKLKPVSNKAGYIRDCLARPQKYGFVCDGDEWQEPPDPERDAQKRRIETQRLRAEQAAAERNIEAESMARESARIAAWNARSETAKELIRAIVRKREPLYVTKDNDSYVFRTRCMALAEEMTKAGHL